MSVLKSAPSTSAILERYISATPTPRVVDALLADLTVMNRTLLSDAIMEAEASLPAGHKLLYTEKRLLIHEIYTRKMKEIASLYPVLFCVENALRSALSVRLTTLFDRRDWWIVIRDAITAGKTHKDFKHICGKKCSPAFIREVFFIISTMMNGPSAARLNSPSPSDDLFYSLLTLGQLTNLIKSDWSLARPMFAPQHMAPWIGQTPFKTRMKTLKEARDAVFHSNPIRNRTSIMKVADEVLDALSIHLGDWDSDLKNTSYSRTRLSRPRDDRHILPARPFEPIKPAG